MTWRGILLAPVPLVLVGLIVWVDETRLLRPPPAAGDTLLVAGYLVGAAGIVILPLARTAKCWLGAIYTVVVVPGMLLVGLLTACAMGDCI